MELSDLLQSLRLSKPELLGLYVAVVSLFLTFYFYYPGNDEERPVHFSIPSPEQCKSGWHGQVLEKPTIKVGPIKFLTAASSLISACRYQARVLSNAIVLRMGDCLET